MGEMNFDVDPSGEAKGELPDNILKPSLPADRRPFLTRLASSIEITPGFEDGRPVLKVTGGTDF
jgi:hypothetical protein